MTLNGIYPIVPTPFLDNGEIDFPSIERLIDFMALKKVHGLAIMGALGEGHNLTESERTQVINIYRRRLPQGMGLVEQLFRIVRHLRDKGYPLAA